MNAYACYLTELFAEGEVITNEQKPRRRRGFYSR
jgi:hypothetical protein